MLIFKEDSKHYIIIEEIHSFHDTKRKTVKYTKDLKSCQVEYDPWQEMTPIQVDWFKKFYLPHYNGMDVNVTLDSQCLKTVKLQYIRKYQEYYITMDNTDYKFPDNDRLILEDVYGYLYTRRFESWLKPNQMIFKRI